MSNDELDTTPQPTEDTDPVLRRKFLAASCGAGGIMLAGCSSKSSSDRRAEEDSTDNTDSETDSGDSTDGNFRLLISDQPADIGDFDRLDVSFDRARIFEGTESEDTGSDASEMDGSDGSVSNGTDGEIESGRKAADGETAETDSGETTDGSEGTGGFYNLDLSGTTVDLTQVLDDRAVSVFDGQLSEGSYNKIELYVADIEGVVDGEMAEVKVPSGKLQITHSFEITAEETVDFVFDINVVKRGQGLRYNLTPVISESGVGGKDVEVEEVGDTAEQKRPEDESERQGSESTASTDTDEGEMGQTGRSETAKQNSSSAGE